jgi:hypothetical protein
MASKNVFGMLPGCSEEESLRLYPSRFVGPMKAINGVPIARIFGVLSDARSIHSVVEGWLYCRRYTNSIGMLHCVIFSLDATFLFHEDLVPRMIFHGDRCINPRSCQIVCSAMGVHSLALVAL